MTATRRAAIAMLSLGAVLAGCATSRSEIKLATPATTATASASARPVLIRNVLDERVFEQAPSDPSIPSLGFEGANAAPDAIKARAVGRKRGGFGKALGDVLLQEGQSVTGLMRESVAAALQDAGYRVVSAPEAGGPPPLVVDVHVKQFWSWFQPGFWAITLNANVETGIDVVSVKPVHVKVHVEQAGLAATDGAWLEIVDKARQAYRVEAAARIKAAGL